MWCTKSNIGDSKLECCICRKEIEKEYNSLTGKVYWDSGNNALPVKNGRCCSICNVNIVIPARISNLARIENLRK